MVKNNKFLIDTHIFILWMGKNKLLSADIYKLLKDSEKQIFLSVASIWEMIIKKSKNKLTFSVNLETDIQDSGFTILSVNLNHVLGLQELPKYHNDPFDRIMVAQAKSEGLTFISNDVKIKKYFNKR